MEAKTKPLLQPGLVKLSPKSSSPQWHKLLNAKKKGWALQPTAVIPP